MKYNEEIIKTHIVSNGIKGDYFTMENLKILSIEEYNYENIPVLVIGYEYRYVNQRCGNIVIGTRYVRESTTMPIFVYNKEIRKLKFGSL